MNASSIVKIGILGSAALLATVAQAQEPVLVLDCNEGALTVTQEKGPFDQNLYTVHIQDAGVVDYFLAESEKYVQPQVSGYPWDGQIRKSFSRTVEVKTSPSKTITISEFKRSSENSFGVGQYEPYLSLDGRGGLLSIRSGTMVGSHSMASWEVGNWYFESCTKR